MFARRFLLLGLGLALSAAAGCGDGVGAGRYPDAVVWQRDAGDASDTPRPPEGDSGDVRQPTFEPADPTLTRLLVPHPATLVGAGTTSCTNGLPSRPDIWCAFSRKAEGTASPELWVFNVTQAAAAASPPACDGTSTACLRLTTTLWTGTSLEGPTHPYAHRFDGDTLIFHAGPTPATQDPYIGAVWAWRPGWGEARRLTTDQGLSCVADRRVPVVSCVDGVTIEPTGSFLPAFRVRGFDLRAGRLGDVPPAGPLAVVEHLQAQGPGDLEWQAAFTPAGDRFVYSSATAGASTTVVKWIAIDTGPVGVPAVLAEDAADWRISHDGARLYHRQGVDLDLFLGPGRLATTELPPGSGTKVLAENVSRYRLLGAHDEIFTDQDRGVLIEQDGRNEEMWSLLPDPTHPFQRVSFPGRAYGIDVATDLRHSLYYQDGPNGLPRIQILANEGGATCSPKRDMRSETYGGHFSHTSRLVFWIEYRGDSEEGWYALPETCGEARKFGDYVTGFIPVRDDYVVFRGTDFYDSAYHLQYARLAMDAAAPRVLPRMVEKDVDDSIVVLGDGANVHIVYSLSREDAPTRGIFVHGPLPH